jgi:DNA polymerase III epsilon subunit-like protein
MRFLALDFETSGLDPKRHAPVSLGVALFEGGEPVWSNEWTIAPPSKDGKITREYDVCALEISGVSWVKLKKEGTPIWKVLSDFNVYSEQLGLRDVPVVAFNAPFDFGWYSELLFLGGRWNQSLRRFEGAQPPLCGPWHCARLIACSSLNLERYTLDAVSAHFGLSRSTELHGALEDAVLAGHVYQRLLGIEKQAVAA